MVDVRHNAIEPERIEKREEHVKGLENAEQENDRVEEEEQFCQAAAWKALSDPAHEQYEKKQERVQNDQACLIRGPLEANKIKEKDNSEKKKI